MRSARNKTIDLSVEEGGRYLDRCLRPEDGKPISDADCRTILGDSFSVMPLLPPGFADLIIADPPYNLSKDFGAGRFSRMGREDYVNYTRRWLALAAPLLREGGSIYVCCDWRCSSAVEEALGELFTVRNRISWQREKGRGAAKNWKNSMEDIWFATKGGDYFFDLEAVKLKRRVIAPYRVEGRPKDWQEGPGGAFRMTCPGNFWDDITVPYWSMPENTAHPTQKPEKLLAKLILASSRPGDMVFDPFLGSGSTSVTAKKLGRRYCGVEIDPRYCVWAERRLELAEEDKSIQGFKSGVFLERNTRE